MQIEKLSADSDDLVRLTIANLTRGILRVCDQNEAPTSAIALILWYFRNFSRR